MASSVANAPNIASLNVTGTMATPTTYTIVPSGTLASVLNDTSDTTYVQQTAATSAGTNARFWCLTQSVAMPVGSRVVYARAVVRAWRTAASKHTYQMLLGYRHTDGTGHYGSAITTTTLTTAAATYYSPSVDTFPDGVIIDQAAISRGALMCVFCEIGGSTVESTAFRTSSGKVELSWDMPPTVSNVAPAGTLNDTATPTVTWDYADDLQPQAKYQVQILNGALVVYDSGVVTSSSTTHTIATPLANGTYKAKVMVWQAWGGPGGDFPALAAATSSFSVSVLPLPAPGLSAAPSGGTLAITMSGHVNLLNRDDASFENGIAGWTSTNASLKVTGGNVLDGLQAMMCTVPSTGVAQVTQASATSVGWPYTFVPYLSAAVRGPSSISGKTVQLGCTFYDANYAVISTFTGTAQSLTSNTYTRYFDHPTSLPANTAYLAMFLKFTGTVANDVLVVDDAMIADQVNASIPWGRGGVITSTANELTYDDSTIGTTSNWASVSTTDSAAQSSDFARHGTTSLKMVKGGAAGTIDVILGNSTYMPIDPTGMVQARLSVYSPTVSRNITLLINVYDASFTYIGAVYAGGATTVGAWKEFIVTNTGFNSFLSTAVYVGVELQIASAAVNEIHYMDTAAIYALSQAQYTNESNLGWQPGYFPLSDAPPIVYVQKTDQNLPQPGGTLALYGSNAYGTGAYSSVPTTTVAYDDSIVWNDVFSIPLLNAAANGLTSQLTFLDYEVKSGVVRNYRAYISKEENRTPFVSTYGTTTGMATFLQAWMHSRLDPAGTLHQFVYDGAGRSESAEVVSGVAVLDGAEYPFAEFSQQSNGSLSVTLQLPTVADQVALQTIQRQRGEVVFRDQRGRGISGVLGPVSYNDEVWGQTASFTITRTGIQP